MSPPIVAVSVGVALLFGLAAVAFAVMRRRDTKSAAPVHELVPDFALPLRSGAGEFRISQQRGQNLLLLLMKGDW